MLEVLHPPSQLMTGTEADANNNSLVLRLTWGEAEFLLTGDIGTEAERLLLDSSQDLAADLLKVAHHGSGGSSCNEFLAAVAPTYAVISVGEDNRFGHPQEAVLERLASMGDSQCCGRTQRGQSSLSQMVSSCGSDGAIALRFPEETRPHDRWCPGRKRACVPESVPEVMCWAVSSIYYYR